MVEAACAHAPHRETLLLNLIFVLIEVQVLGDKTIVVIIPCFDDNRISNIRNLIRSKKVSLSGKKEN
jgi:hypothetical protein